MLALLCSLGLATAAQCLDDGIIVQRVYAPAPFTPTHVTVVRYHNSQRIDVVYPPEFTLLYAPVLNDEAGGGQ
jgi:hypothetical protein